MPKNVPEGIFLWAFCLFTTERHQSLNTDEVVELLEKSQKLGCYSANVLLGQMMESNLDSDFIGHYEKAHEAGVPWGTYRLACVYLRESSRHRNDERGIQLLKIATDARLPAALTDLGFRYEKGIGVERSVEKAVQMYRLAADQNDSVGQLNLGVCYVRGIGLEKDVDAGRELLEKSHDNGNQIAGRLLTDLHR